MRAQHHVAPAPRRHTHVSPSLPPVSRSLSFSLWPGCARMFERAFPAPTHCATRDIDIHCCTAACPCHSTRQAAPAMSADTLCRTRTHCAHLAPRQRHRGTGLVRPAAVFNTRKSCSRVNSQRDPRKSSRLVNMPRPIKFRNRNLQLS